MGDNIHQLTSLPYRNMEEEDEYIDHTSPSSIQVEITGPKKRKTIYVKFNALEKEKKIALIVALVLTAIASFSIIWASFEKSEQDEKDHMKNCKAVTKHLRLDAGLGQVNSKEECLKLGSCWDSTALATSPQCYYSIRDERGYYVHDMNSTSSGLFVALKRNPSPKIVSSEHEHLKCLISYETDSRLRVKIYPDNSEFEVPVSEHHASQGHRMQYVIDVTQKLFGFSVSRTHETSTTILNTTIGGLVFSDQLLQINMMLSSNKVYGLGGSPNGGLLRRMEFEYQSIWSRTKEGSHGVHPFLMNVEKDGHANGILFLNSNAMDLILNPHPAVTFRTTGGILDFYIFLGPSPNDVMKQYTEQVGRPYLPPLWALGYHFGSENFQTAEDYHLDTMKNMSLPLDCVWAGKILPENYKTLISDVHKSDKRFCMHTSPAVRNNNSDYYKAGVLADIFVKKANKTELVAQTEEGTAVFVDFFHPKAEDWLTKGAQDWQLDGLYLTDNEPSTLSSGSVVGCTNNNLDNPVYQLRSVKDLKKGTLCPSALHYDNTPHFFLHNLYAWKQAQTISRVLRQVKNSERHLLLSRGSYIGSGSNTGHWIQDNMATWQHMNHSIVVMLDYNMYGMPLVGANICGYKVDKVDEELCVRWHQLAVFYPLAIRYTKTETQVMEFSEETKKRIKQAVELRYSLIPTLYTQFYKSHTTGEPVVSPMFFDYIDDKNVLAMYSQFMFAGNVMVAPVLRPNVKTQDVYFPDDVWYDYENPGTVIQKQGHVTRHVTLDKQTYYVRGGSIVVRYHNTGSSTKQLNEAGDYILDVYLKEGRSSGELYLDDGVSPDPIDRDMYLLVKFNATQESIRSELSLKYPGHVTSNKIQTINIRGLNKLPVKVYVKNNVATWPNFTSADGLLSITDLNLSVSEAFMVKYG